MTDADFLSITHGGRLCDGEGGLGEHAFELIMREQVARLIRCKHWSNRCKHWSNRVMREQVARPGPVGLRSEEWRRAVR